MRYAFIVEHRLVFSIRAMCRCLSVQPSGFYAWLKDPLSRRAREDERQTKLIRAAWRDSGKVYGYRKLHCPPSALLRQFGGFREGRISGSSQPFRSADETEIGAGVRIPIHSGRVFRFEAGHRSDLMSATIPI